MRGEGNRLRAIDWGVLGYLALALGVGVGRIGRVPGVEWSLLPHGLAVLLVFLLGSPGLGRFGRAVREIYPLLLVVILYGALDLVSGHGAVTTHDTTVQRWEEWVFGEQPSRTWWQARPSPLWSTAMHAVYASYYGVVIAGPLAFLARGEIRSLRRTVGAIAAAYGVCFAIFLVFPVAGPNYEFPRPAAEFLDNPAARLVYGLLAGGSSYGAAFPSSHVAAALAAAVVTWKGAPRLGLVLLVPALLLPFAVVYTQMHYGVDALAGVLVGGLVAGVAWKGER